MEQKENYRQKRLLLYMALALIVGGLFFLGLGVTQKLDSQEGVEKLEKIQLNDAVGLGNEASQSAQVTRVVDGDTIEVKINGKDFTVRYIGIDTPETVDPRRPVGCFGKEASNENKKIVEGKTVYLTKDVSETDKYGRLVRFIYVKQNDGSLLFVNDYLVRQGYAKAYTYPPDVSFSEQFLEAEREARENKKGLWQKC